RDRTRPPTRPAARRSLAPAASTITALRSATAPTNDPNHACVPRRTRTLGRSRAGRQQLERCVWTVLPAYKLLVLYLANSCENSPRTQAQRVVERLDAGAVWVNSHNMVDANMPFGGVKASGIG